MELNEFILKFADQFDDTEASEFTADCEFMELDEWSSLTALAIIAFIKTEYNKTIHASEIRSCKTISDLYELVKSK